MAAALTFIYDDGIINSLKLFEQHLGMYGLNGTIAVIAAMSDASQKGPPYMMASCDVGSGSATNPTCAVPIASWDQINGFASRGTFDLCSHSVTHPVFTGLTPAEAEFETAQAKTMIEANTGKKIDTFVFPHYDYDTVSAEAALRHYIAARTWGDKNLNDPGTTEYGALDSVTIMHDTLATDITPLIDQAITQNSWFIVTSHTVLEGDPLGWEACPIAVHDGVYAYAQSKIGQLWNAGFSPVAKYLEEREAASVSTSPSGSQISVTLTDNLGNDATFDVPLTLKSAVPSGWSSASVTQGSGAPVSLTIVTENGAHYVYYDAVPDGGPIVISGS
jgi:peptidoglycan/xylan/chitin deacetylase (PgdA/CDA1 family)